MQMSKAALVLGVIITILAVVLGTTTNKPVSNFLGGSIHQTQVTDPRLGKWLCENGHPRFCESNPASSHVLATSPFHPSEARGWAEIHNM